MWANLLVTVLKSVATQISSELLSVAIKRIETKMASKTKKEGQKDESSH